MAQVGLVSSAALPLSLVVVALIWRVLIPIDVHVLRVIPDLPGALGQWIGVGLFGVGFALIVWTFDHNSFATPTVKVQEDRGRWVIDTGPYAGYLENVRWRLIPRVY